MTKELKKFVEESFAKIKKAKKSPKNFHVFKVGDTFKYKEASKSSALDGLLLGGLDTLYAERDIVTEVKKEETATGKPCGCKGKCTCDKKDYSVYLKHAGSNKLHVVKLIKEYTNLGLKESKEIMDSAPCLVMSNLTEKTAEKLTKELLAVGATANMSQDIPLHTITQQYVTQGGEHVFVRMYENFSLTWIPMIKNLFAGSGELCSYNELPDNLKNSIDAKMFNDFKNWLK